MTKLERETRKAIREWCETQGYKVKSLGMVFPRAHVVATDGRYWLTVAVPPMEALEGSRAHEAGSILALSADKELGVGDWCSVVYVVSDQLMEPVAIPAVVVEG